MNFYTYNRHKIHVEHDEIKTMKRKPSKHFNASLGGLKSKCPSLFVLYVHISKLFLYSQTRTTNNCSLHVRLFFGLACFPNACPTRLPKNFFSLIKNDHYEKCNHFRYYPEPPHETRRPGSARFKLVKHSSSICCRSRSERSSSRSKICWNT